MVELDQRHDQDPGITPPKSPELFHIKSKPTAVIIGGGAAGLNASLEAQAQGFTVKEIITARPPRKSTAGQAGASFKPHLAVYDPQSFEAFELTKEEYDRITADHVGEHHGINRNIHWEASDNELPEKPYLYLMGNVQEFDKPRQIPGKYKHALRYETYLLDTQKYIKWMVGRIEEQGTTIRLHKVHSLEEVEKLEADVVFDCTGMGADELGTVQGLIPVRGQTVVVSKIPKMDWSISADGFYTYNREDNALIGGTAEYGERETKIDVATVVKIIHGNLRAVPDLGKAKIIKPTAGIRPHHPDGGIIQRTRLYDKDLVSINGLSGWGLTGGRGMAVMATRLVKR